LSLSVYRGSDLARECQWTKNAHLADVPADAGLKSFYTGQCSEWGAGDHSPTISSGPLPRADLPGLIDSLTVAQHVLEMYRRNVADNPARRLLDRLANRNVKILAETRRLNKPQE
jgi:hypothetical protein